MSGTVDPGMNCSTNIHWEVAGEYLRCSRDYRLIPVLGENVIGRWVLDIWNAGWPLALHESNPAGGILQECMAVQVSSLK